MVVFLMFQDNCDIRNADGDQDLYDMLVGIDKQTFDDLGKDG